MLLTLVSPLMSYASQPDPLLLADSGVSQREQQCPGEYGLPALNYDSTLTRVTTAFIEPTYLGGSLYALLEALLKCLFKLVLVAILR